MSIDQSLKKKGGLVRARNVLRRDERIAKLIEAEKWNDERSPYGLPKVRVFRLVAKKVKKEKKEDAAAPGAKKDAKAPAAAAGGDKKAAAKK